MRAFNVPLWASTSTKNPNYPATQYIDQLIGRDSVNTMTLETIEAFRDRGQVHCGAIRQGLDESAQVLRDLDMAGISLKAVTDQLTVEGIGKFTTSLHTLFAVIEQRQSLLVAS